MSARTLAAAKAAATAAENNRIFLDMCAPRDIECWFEGILWTRALWTRPSGLFGWSRWARASYEDGQ